MVWIDYAIIAVIGFSCLVSLIRGFVREALSLVTWGCAFFVASHYYTYLSVWFTGFEDELVRNGDCYRDTVYRDRLSSALS